MARASESVAFPEMDLRDDEVRTSAGELESFELARSPVSGCALQHRVWCSRGGSAGEFFYVFFPVAFNFAHQLFVLRITVQFFPVLVSLEPGIIVISQADRTL